MKYTIEVTAEDIEKGEPVDCWDCPIALAAKRALPTPEYISVGFVRIETLDGKCALPEKAQRFIDKFDGGEPVEPFSFEIEIPDGNP